MSVKDTACVISTTLFLILILVACATIVPQVYEIEHNTGNLVDGSTVYRGIMVIHSDIVYMIGELNYFAEELIALNSSLAEMNTNINTLVNGKRVGEVNAHFARLSARFVALASGFGNQ